MNEQNLLPLNKRSKEKAREIQSKGGKASGARRKQEATIRQLFKSIGGMPLPNVANATKQLEKMGVDSTLVAGLIYSIFTKGIKTGDLRALEAYAKYTNQDMRDGERKERAARLKNIEANTRAIEAQMKRDESGGDEGLKRFLMLSRTNDIEELFSDEEK